MGRHQGLIQQIARLLGPLDNEERQGVLAMLLLVAVEHTTGEYQNTVLVVQKDDHVQIHTGVPDPGVEDAICANGLDLSASPS